MAAWLLLSDAPRDCQTFACPVASTGHEYVGTGPGWSRTMSAVPLRSVGVPSRRRLTRRPDSGSRYDAMRHSNPPSTAPSFASRSRIVGRSYRLYIWSRTIPGRWRS
ncbi:hypothetical protein ADK47_04560 [Streptomyces rimosus subsp. rimosus]|nr:hypothetical protein DF17_35650 [Streptomyces rimosus]KOG67090.1 hypothetical protein ADK78_41885 [Kitasatospora aureofaciens]KOT44671.1 hypothetical protein ADK42_04680 [Streptomyces rimosus subsp. rimosus]KOT45781.1 hypothetical protein ADK84_04065 [Streptomyces sp. NRRL WC-3701]KEF18384.1 hypothetical protein DF18_22745 [Streptomyces rimosus]